jgi:hypothetical protein
MGDSVLEPGSWLSMARAEKMYRRLPGRVASVAHHHRLWLGPDHLLWVRATGFSEEYKRFYFRDIHAFVIRKTSRRGILTAMFTLVAMVFGLFALLITDPYWRGFWAVLAGLGLLLAAVNWLAGPTCVCHVRTAVQTEQLPTLRRLRITRRVLAPLKQRIEEAQGPLAPKHLQPKPPLGSADAASNIAAQPASEANRPRTTSDGP